MTVTLLYTFFVDSRVGKRGGGVLALIKYHLKPRLISNGSKENIYCHVISVAFGSTDFHVILMIVYRPPDKTIDGTKQLLSCINSESNKNKGKYLIIGDLNLPYFN